MLPWGGSQQQLGDELSPPELDLPRTQLNLQLGNRVEVLWQLQEDDGEAYTKASPTDRATLL